MGLMAQRPGLGLPTACVATIAKELSTVESVGMSGTARSTRRATYNSRKR